MRGVRSAAASAVAILLCSLAVPAPGTQEDILVSFSATELDPGDGFSLDWLLGDPPGGGGGNYSGTFLGPNAFNTFLDDTPIIDLGRGTEVTAPEPSALTVLLVPLILLGLRQRLPHLPAWGSTLRRT